MTFHSRRKTEEKFVFSGKFLIFLRAVKEKVTTKKLLAHPPLVVQSDDEFPHIFIASFDLFESEFFFDCVADFRKIDCALLTRGLSADDSIKDVRR